MTRPIAEIVTALVCTGLSQEQTILLLELVSAMSTGQSGGSRVESPDDAVERRRKWDREYRRKRRLAARAESADTSTGLSTEQVDTPCNLSSLLPSSESPSGIREVSKKEQKPELVEERAKKQTRATRIPSDWQPTEELARFAIDHGTDPVKLRDEFVDYWIGVPGTRGTKLDWGATWRNRVRAIGKTGGANVQQKRSVQDAAADLVNRMREFDRPAPGDIRGGTGCSVVRLLSQG